MAKVENVLFYVVVCVGDYANKRYDVIVVFVVCVAFCCDYMWQIRGASGKRQDVLYILYTHICVYMEQRGRAVVVDGACCRH